MHQFSCAQSIECLSMRSLEVRFYQSSLFLQYFHIFCCRYTSYFRIMTVAKGEEYHIVAISYDTPDIAERIIWKRGGISGDSEHLPKRSIIHTVTHKTHPVLGQIVQNYSIIDVLVRFRHPLSLSNSIQLSKNVLCYKPHLCLNWRHVK